MTQQELFEDDRYNPGRTSQRAYRLFRPKEGTHMHQMYLALSAGPKTANEAARECVTAAGGQHESYRKCTAKMQKQGLIRVVGTKTCTVTGNQAQALQVVR